MTHSATNGVSVGSSHSESYCSPPTEESAFSSMPTSPSQLTGMGGTQWQGLADTHIETQSHLVIELGVSYQANTICFLNSHSP